MFRTLEYQAFGGSDQPISGVAKLARRTALCSASWVKLDLVPSSGSVFFGSALTFDDQLHTVCSHAGSGVLDRQTGWIHIDALQNKNRHSG